MRKIQRNTMKYQKESWCNDYSHQSVKSASTLSRNQIYRDSKKKKKKKQPRSLVPSDGKDLDISTLKLQNIFTNWCFVGKLLT